MNLLTVSGVFSAIEAWEIGGKANVKIAVGDTLYDIESIDHRTQNPDETGEPHLFIVTAKTESAQKDRRLSQELSPEGQMAFRLARQRQADHDKKGV